MKVLDHFTAAKNTTTAIGRKLRGDGIKTRDHGVKGIKEIQVPLSFYY